MLHPKGSPTIDVLDSTQPLSLRSLHLPLGAVIRPVGAASSPASFRLTLGRCLVGSGPTCDLVINEPTVSRAHVELQLVPEGVVVQDLVSRNGTYYLGQRIERMILGLGGRIQVGAATLALEADTQALDGGAVFDRDEYRGMVGASKAMHHLFTILERLEGSLVTALIEGESGTGKDLVARALREGSSVSKGPFVVLNCGAIPRELVASELFGHKRGAFSGAVESRRGAFELADHGTLFLDEIGELPLEVQPMLLRALEEGEVRPLGGDRAEHVKVRVVAATNRDLSREVEAGRFREDLFYRLAVVRLPVPPLRERPEDIAPWPCASPATPASPTCPPACSSSSRRAPGPATRASSATPCRPTPPSAPCPTRGARARPPSTSPSASWPTWPGATTSRKTRSSIASPASTSRRC
jgi:hypothetical protein